MKQIDEFADIEIGRLDLLPALKSGVTHIVGLHARRQEGGRETLIDRAFGMSLESINMLMQGAMTRCRIGAPPTADIELLTDTNGNLFYRCKHQSPHKWDMNGNRIP